MITDRFDETIFRNSAIVLGTFDGVHIGHTKLIKKAVDFAKKNNVKSVAFTFNSIPSGANEIFGVSQKCRLIEEIGIDVVYVQNFDTSFKSISYIDFMNKYLKFAKYIGVGFNFTFGYKGEGNPEILEEFCNLNGIAFDRLNCVTYENQVVCSTKIRELIDANDFSFASKLLGRDYYIEGKVSQGDKIGHTIGFPTANIEIKKIALQKGVYATLTEINGKKYPSITNYGGKPTVKDGIERIETNLINFNENLYGKTIRVYFISKIREITRFNSLDELSNQLKKDTENTMKLFGENI